MKFRPQIDAVGCAQSNNIYSVSVWVTIYLVSAMASEDKRKKKLASDSRVTLKVPLKTYLRLRNIQDDIRLNAGHVEDISSFPAIISMLLDK